MAALTIFLVEDSPTIRWQLIPALEELATAQVIATAESEDQAVQWLAGHKGGWDLAVVDLFLKQGNGLDVVRWTWGRQPNQSVAVLTNYATTEIRNRCLQAGANVVFDKSTELDQFFEYCRKLEHLGRQ